MKCPFCRKTIRVIDSRPADDNTSIEEEDSVTTATEIHYIRKVHPSCCN